MVLLSLSFPSLQRGGGGGGGGRETKRSWSTHPRYSSRACWGRSGRPSASSCEYSLVWTNTTQCKQHHEYICAGQWKKSQQKSTITSHNTREVKSLQDKTTKTSNINHVSTDNFFFIKIIFKDHPAATTPSAKQPRTNSNPEINQSQVRHSKHWAIRTPPNHWDIGPPPPPPKPLSYPHSPQTTELSALPQTTKLSALPPNHWAIRTPPNYWAIRTPPKPLSYQHSPQTTELSALPQTTELSALPPNHCIPPPNPWAIRTPPNHWAIHTPPKPLSYPHSPNHWAIRTPQTTDLSALPQTTELSALPKPMSYLHSPNHWAIRTPPNHWATHTPPFSGQHASLPCVPFKT